MGQTVNLLTMSSVVRIHLLPQSNLDATFLNILAKIAQLVEHDLAKVGVAGSSPVFRSTLKRDSVREKQVPFFAQKVL